MKCDLEILAMYLNFLFLFRQNIILKNYSLFYFESFYSSPTMDGQGLAFQKKRDFLLSETFS